MASTLSGSIDNTRIIPSGTQEQLPYHWVIFELKALVPGVALDQIDSRGISPAWRGFNDGGPTATPVPRAR
jgi:hypothetical protein